ncbi:MAG TPA: hypothetical protein VI999_00675, partial [Thermoplasmata archaeon]|nr:hypothetical protein [Thermoplasmata archaeon]
VTATVCHKCGSLMKRGEARPPPGGGSVAGAPRVRTPTGTALAPGVSPQPEGGAETPPPEGTESAEGTFPAPRRVIPRSAPAAPPVVQKRVVRRQVGEGQQTESTEGGEGQSTDQKKEDEL